jgi:hypothetical protein
VLLAPIVIQAGQGALGNEFAAADEGQATQYVTITGTAEPVPSDAGAPLEDFGAHVGP